MKIDAFNARIHLSLSLDIFTSAYMFQEACLILMRNLIVWYSGFVWLMYFVHCKKKKKQKKIKLSLIY